MFKLYFAPCPDIQMIKSLTCRHALVSTSLPLIVGGVAAKLIASADEAPPRPFRV